MEEIHINTDIISENDNDIRKVIKEMNEILDMIFELIEKMPVETNEWTGISATKFVNLAKADSANYYLLKDNLLDFCDYLGKYCIEMNKVMKEVVR